MTAKVTGAVIGLIRRILIIITVVVSCLGVRMIAGSMMVLRILSEHLMRKTRHDSNHHEGIDQESELEVGKHIRAEDRRMN